MAQVAIIGTGLVGRAWAISYARAGHEVALWDEFPEAPVKALAFIREAAPELAANGLLGSSPPQALLARIRIESDLGAALVGAAHVQESTPERLDVKREMFGRLDEL